MRAIGYRTPGPIEAPESLLDIELPSPTPGERDLLVAVRAVSVNPVDTKVRRRPKADPSAWQVLGWDAAGVVAEVGRGVTRFRPGDAVFYAGDMTRPGANAELHCVDEQIVGPKPASLSYAEAAALPLTAITAWEAMFDRLDVAKPVPGAAQAILIVGGAGGVGSIAIQLARKRTDLAVIATASRPETAEWARSLGAHHVVDHSRPLAVEVAALGLGAPAFVFSTTGTGGHLAAIAELIAPQGRFALIDDPDVLDINMFQTQERVGPLGVHVHPVDVPHRRHRRPGRVARRSVEARRSGRAENDARRDARNDQRGQPQAGARHPRKRQGSRETGAGGDSRRREPADRAPLRCFVSRAIDMG